MSNLPRSTTRAKWRPKRVPGKMNRTEAAYAEILEEQKRRGEIADWFYEKLKLRLGDDWKLTWTPDFMVLRNDGTVELVDVKGGAGWEEAARVKIKAAAAMFPLFLFVGVKRTSRGFEREEF